MAVSREGGRERERERCRRALHTQNMIVVYAVSDVERSGKKEKIITKKNKDDNIQSIKKYISKEWKIPQID